MSNATEVALHERGALERQEPRSLLESVMRAVANPDIDPARLREFLEIGERLEAREAARQFNEAMRELQPELPVIRKNGQIMYKTGPGPKFAKWDDVHKACMSKLAAHGFSVSFSSPELQGGNALKVVMTVKHVGGHQDTPSMIVPWLDTGGSKSPAQAAISSETLAQRHVFVKYFNILTEDADDDGSGKGVPDRITEQQALKIADIIAECENREKGFSARFSKWLKAEIQVASVGELFQGQQHEAVLSKLREKMAALGVK